MTASGPHPPPLLAPGLTLGGATAAVAGALERPAPGWWWAATAAAGLFLAMLVVAATVLFVQGIGIWGVNIPVAWGFALANYVWWIGIASGGTIISALFHLTGAGWRTATNRLAETLTLWAAACAGLMPIFHLGRQGLFYWLFPYPNVMTVWPQFRSPLLWDFFALLCYIAASILFWYFGAIPDFATMRDRAAGPWRLAYGVLAMGWRGSARQWTQFQAAYGIMAALLAPMVISVHSVVGLDFAAGLTPGWHSTQFPPYFVFGAVYSGFATVILLLVPVRRLYRLEAFVTDRHFDILARLMLACGLLLTYAYVMEAFDPFYSGDRAAIRAAEAQFFGRYSWAYWSKIALNSVIPMLLWVPRLRVTRSALVAIAAGIVLGMWLERYLIVLNSLAYDHMPSMWRPFVATGWDWATLVGSVGLFLTGFLVVLRVVPAVSMAELRHLIRREAAS